jgi:hypothetical protein
MSDIRENGYMLGIKESMLSNILYLLYLTKNESDVKE